MADKTGTNAPIGQVLSPRAESFVLDCVSSGTAVTIGRCVTVTGITQSGLAWKPKVDQATAAPTGVGAPVLGIALQTIAATAGLAIGVLTRGVVIAEAGGSVTVGVGVVTNTSGQVVANAGVVAGDNEFLGVGICVLQNGTSAATDGIGILVIR